MEGASLVPYLEVDLPPLRRGEIVVLLKHLGVSRVHRRSLPSHRWAHKPPSLLSWEKVGHLTHRVSGAPPVMPPKPKPQMLGGRAAFSLPKVTPQEAGREEVREGVTNPREIFPGTPLSHVNSGSLLRILNSVYQPQTLS